MDSQKSPNKILWIGAIGSLAIIALSWADEWIQPLAVLFHGTQQVPNWRECTTETVVVAAVWAVTFVVTRRLVRRLRYLEEFLRICAWCKKIDLGNEWGSLETYFDAKLKTKTTHGICPTCAAKQREEIGLLKERHAGAERD